MKIELYPKKDIVIGRYLGDDSDYHLFECPSDGSVVIVNKHWACLEKNIITHDSRSSFSILKSKPRRVRI